MNDGFGDGGWIGSSDSSDNYCYDNKELRKEIQDETDNWVAENHRVNSVYFDTLRRRLFSFLRKPPEISDVIDAEWEDIE